MSALNRRQLDAIYLWCHHNQDSYLTKKFYLSINLLQNKLGSFSLRDAFGRDVLGEIMKMTDEEVKALDHAEMERKKRIDAYMRQPKN